MQLIHLFVYILWSPWYVGAFSLSGVNMVMFPSLLFPFSGGVKPVLLAGLRMLVDTMFIPPFDLCWMSLNDFQRGVSFSFLCLNVLSLLLYFYFDLFSFVFCFYFLFFEKFFIFFIEKFIRKYTVNGDEPMALFYLLYFVRGYSLTLVRKLDRWICFPCKSENPYFPQR